MPRIRNALALAACLMSSSAFAQLQISDIPPLFDSQVTRKLSLTSAEVDEYRVQLRKAIAGLSAEAQTGLVAHPEFFIMVDRNPQSQRLVLFVGDSAEPTYVGASPVATGSTGTFDHYITPLGIYEHTLLSDFRAEGSKNQNGIRGYGAKGMRVWDFGWYPATKGWGAARKEAGNIRFQMHATDPQVLEPKLGTPGSKGCVRIPASLNAFLDQYGVLDAHYAKVTNKGKQPWVWGPKHVSNAFQGRYLVVVDSSVKPVGI